jgi:GNAT superfamily N-acetyltransferase
MTVRKDQANVQVRRATEQDLPEIVELWKGLMDFHARRDPIFTPGPDADKAWQAFMRKNMAADNAAVFVADCASRIVGYCLALISDYPPVLAVQTYGELMDLMVHADYRRQGIGECLVIAARAWYSERRIQRIEVRVAVTNEISTVFWRRMGFRPYLETLASEPL